jgi:hypothetical protein
MTTNRRLFFRLSVAISLLLLTILAGCGENGFSPPTATPSPTADIGIGGAVVELLEQEAYIRLTQQAIDNQRIEMGAIMTATQMVEDAIETQQARSDNATATSVAATATHQVWQVTVQAAQSQDTATAQAQATATAIHHQGVTATVIAGATATSAYSTQMAPIWEAERQAIEARAEKAEIELRQAQATELVDAWWLYVLVTVLVIAFLFYLYKKSQVGVILDERGRLRLVMVGQTALNPDLMIRPVMDFRDGQISAPRLDIADEAQQQIAHEAKIVDAISMLPPAGGQQGMRLVGNMTSQTPTGAVNIQVVQPGQLGDIRRELDSKLEDDE